ncbi:hypothetical protein P4E94_19625 [Pontiellaceae bacterium B12219]|nr:hypothetical protein [Pontiellaceae bacterium B12219]
MIFIPGLPEVPDWVNDMEGWLSKIWNGLRRAGAVASKAWDWMLKNVYALIPVFMALFKLVFDFILEIGERIQTKLLNIDVEALQHTGTSVFSALGEIFQIANYIVPLDELFLTCTCLLSLWAVCVVVRFIMSVRRLILG